MKTIEEHVEHIRVILESSPIVPADDPGPKFRLEFTVRPSPGHEGAVLVMFRSTLEYQDDAWRAFEEAVEVLAAAGYERVSTGTGGVFRPIPAPGR